MIIGFQILRLFLCTWRIEFEQGEIHPLGSSDLVSHSSIDAWSMAEMLYGSTFMR